MQRPPVADGRRHVCESGARSSRSEGKLKASSPRMQHPLRHPLSLLQAARMSATRPRLQM